MTVIRDVWQYGDPQHELQSPLFDEQWFYGEPQHERTAPLNVELRESPAYLRSWTQYTQQQRHRDRNTKHPISTPPSVATPR